MAERRRLNREAVGRSAKHKITTKTKKVNAETNRVLTEIIQFGYDAVKDAASELPRQRNGAARITKLRRTREIPARYTPEMQFKKFIKEAREGRVPRWPPTARAPPSEIKLADYECFLTEAREATFNIFDNEIDLGELDFNP